MEPDVSWLEFLDSRAKRHTSTARAIEKDERVSIEEAWVLLYDWSSLELGNPNEPPLFGAEVAQTIKDDISACIARQPMFALKFFSNILRARVAAYRCPVAQDIVAPDTRENHRKASLQFATECFHAACRCGTYVGPVWGCLIRSCLDALLSFHEYEHEAYYLKDLFQEGDGSGDLHRLKDICQSLIKFLSVHPNNGGAEEQMETIRWCDEQIRSVITRQKSTISVGKRPARLEERVQLLVKPFLSREADVLEEQVKTAISVLERVYKDLMFACNQATHFSPLVNVDVPGVPSRTTDSRLLSEGALVGALLAHYLYQEVAMREAIIRFAMDVSIYSRR